MVYIYIYKKSLNQVRDLEHFEMSISNSKKSKKYETFAHSHLMSYSNEKKYKYGLHTFARKRLHEKAIARVRSHDRGQMSITNSKKSKKIQNLHTLS